MELYLNFCSKKAKAASVKTATSSLADEKMLSRQVNRLQDGHQLAGHPEVTQFQNWLLMDHLPFKDQERLIRHRYLDMINRELEYRERRAEEQRRQWMDREERRHWDHMRRKLGLRRKIEEEWKAKEMLLLSRIVEDVKREARIEEQRRRNREESDRKKQALLEKKMAYHLQKMQQNGLKREDTGKNTDYRGLEVPRPESYTPTKKKKASEDIKTLYTVTEQKPNKGGHEKTIGVHQSPSGSKNVTRNSSPPTMFQSNVHDNNTMEQKKDGMLTKKPSPTNGKGGLYPSAPETLLSTQTSPTRTFNRTSQTFMGPAKAEDYNISFAPNTSLLNENKRESKRLSYDTGPQAPEPSPNTYAPHLFTNIHPHNLQKKVTSDELNRILQNIMAWVVATVTSILYPAITRYEERLRSQVYHGDAESALSSESSSFCSTCSEGFTCTSYTAPPPRPFPGSPRAFSVDIALRRPPTPLKPLSAHVEHTVVEETYRAEGPPSSHVEHTVVEKTYHAEGPPSAQVERTVVEKTYSAHGGPPVTTTLTYKTATGVYAHTRLRSCKSDSYLLTSFKAGAQKSKDATTETERDSLEAQRLPKPTARAEIQNLEKIFVNFKCHLKGETELILESVFQEIMSDLTQAVPAISSVTAEVFVDPCEPELDEVPSNVDISSVASDIVENMLEKLQTAVEKKCVEMFAQEDWPVEMDPCFLTIGERLLPPPSGRPPSGRPPSGRPRSWRPPSWRPPTAPPAHPREPMCDVAEDMVQTILGKLMALAAGRQNELPHLAAAAKPPCPPRTPGPPGTFLRGADARRAGPEPEAAGFLAKEGVQGLISSIFAQSSLVGYIEEAISTILGYVQTELNNERLVASEETVVFLQLLDDIFTQLHQEPVKAEAPRGRRPRPRPPSHAEEEYRLAGTTIASGPGPRRPLPPINVPGMVLYSDEDSEEIDRLVENALDSSLRSERGKSQDWGPECWFSERSACLDRSSRPPPRPASLRSKVLFYEGSKTEAPGAHKKEVFKGKVCSTKDTLTFSQDQKHQIQKASASVIKGVLMEMLKSLSCPPGTPGGSAFSGKPPGLSVQEQLDQLFSVSEVNEVAQDITEAVINILHAALGRIPDTPEGPVPPSGRHTPLDHTHTPDMAREAPHEKPLNIWFDSETKMKYLSSLDLGPETASLPGSEAREPQLVDDISGNIVDTVFKKLKGLVYPKLQVSTTPPCAEPSSLHRQLSAYAAKVVGIVLQAIQDELELGQKSPPEAAGDDGKPLGGRELPADSHEVDSLVSDLGKDFVASPLLSCICEMLSSAHSDRSSVSVPPEEPGPSVSCGPDGIGKPPRLPSRQEKQSFYRSLATPCAIHSEPDGKDCKDGGKLQVLDSIGETLLDMLCHLLGAGPEGPPPCAQPPREKTSESQGTALKLSPHLQHLSRTILDSILAKLCQIDADAGCAASGATAASESLDIDNPSFKSIIEEMAKCTDIISGILSRMLGDSSREEADGKATAVAPGPCRTGSTRETHPNRLTAMAADILNMVFAKLEGFASGSLGALDPVREGQGRKASAEGELPGGGAGEAVDTCEELLLSALYTHAKRASSTILKAIQSELGGSPGDQRASAKSPSPERQLLKSVINLIIDVVSSDVLADDAESQGRAMESCGYRPTYGNFLPGGAEPDPCLEDAEKEFGAEGTLPREESQPGSLKQWVLMRTLNKIEGKLKEPQKSPIVPIIRNILNEIFQGALANQLNVRSLSRSPLGGAPHDVEGELPASASVPFIDQKTGPLVSEADVTVVVGDVVTTVLHKLYAAAMTQRGAGESRYKTISFSANVSFHVPARAEQSSVAMLDGDPCPVPPSLTARGNVAEDIIQEILTNLETFATYKVRSLFCPQIQFTVPMPFPAPPDKSILSKVLSAKGLYPDDGFPPYTMDHVLEKASGCQLSLNKLNSHATEVARKILQGIKHELDKERESPFLAHSFMVSEGIASQIVNTVLGIVSCRGKFDKPDSEEELPAGLRGGVIERLFNRTEYRKELQLQIQDVMESILCDIYEKTLHQNNLAVPAPVPRGLQAGQHPAAANIGLSVEGANTVVPQLSVPKSDVMLMSNDIVDLVLHNLNSAVMLGVRPERAPPPPPPPARLPLPFCEVFPQAECRLPPLMGPQSDGNAECFPSSENGRAACAAVASQIAVVQRDDPSKPAPDPCEENAHFITTTIVNQLESFATKSIDSMITLPLQPTEKSLVSPGLEPCEPEDGLFRDPSQRASAGNVLKLPAETVLGHKLASPAFASYRQTRGPALRLPHASLQEYADVIASVILKLIKNDLDLEIQRAHLYPNNISFQENIAVSEIVDNTLRVLNAKRSAREIQFYSKDRPGGFAPLAGPDEALLGQRERDGGATLPLFSQLPLEQQRVERESQRAVLEDIFMRGGESKQREKDALIAPVKEALRKVYQQVIKVKGHLPPFNETPFAAVSTSKTKTSDVTPKTVAQSHITSAANDIVDSVLGEMYTVVVTSLHGSPPKEAFEGHGAFPTPPSCVEEAGQAGGGSDSTGLLVPQAYPSPGDQNTALLDGGPQQPSPLQVGKDLVQMVLDKITHFAAMYLDEAPERCADELQPQRLQSLKVAPKGSLQQSFKTSLKAKSKVTSLPNLKTKPLLGPAGAKAKGKAKAGPGERIPKGSQSKTCLGLPHMLTAGDAKGPQGARLPATDLRAHAARVTSAILEITVTKFEKAKQSEAMVSVKALPLDQIVAASRLVRAVLQGVYVPGAHGLAPPGTFSALALGDLKPSPGHARVRGIAETRACFYLENVSSQLEQIFPKDGIFKKMFDKWQAEANDMESEKCNLLVVAENVLTVISMKSKELEYSLSLLNLTHPQAWESGLHGLSKGASVRAEATKAQINMFAREIVEMLLEKLQLCFLSQMATPDGKEAPGSRREHAAQSKLGFPAKHALSSGGVPFYCVDPKDPAWLGSAKQMVLDMVDRVLGMLESFVDLQFKHTCKYEFSEMVKMPVENLFPAQQRLLSKKMLPKPQSLRRLADDARSNSIICKENAQNVFLQVHAFHSELLTCAVSITRDMLGVIKSKLDGEIGQAEPPGGGLHENVAASEIIGALMDQCTHVSESLITNLPSLLPEVENTYIVNHLALATDVKVPKAKEVHFGSASPQVSVPGLAFYPEDDVRERYRAPPSMPPYARGPGKGPGRSPGPVGRPDSANTPTSSRNKVPGCGPREWPFDRAVLGAGSLPEGSILQKLSKRVTESTEEALKQGLSFLEMGKAKNPKVFHYGTPKPAGSPNQTQTTVSPLKICLAAENIVNTVLSSYGFPGQPPDSERTETIKPFFMSAPSPGGHGGDKKSVLTTWGHRASCIPRGGSGNPEASREDFSLLQKWEVKSDPKVRTVKEFEVIAFADHELGPNEINLVARHVTTCVVTYFQNFKSRVSSEMMAIISALSRKTYASEQRLRSIYNDSSLCQLCEHLTESVICHLISSISDGIQCGREREKAWESQTSGYNKIISINSQVFGNRSISIGDLALNISEIITKILFNSNIIEPDIAQQMFSSQKKYIYCPGVTATDFDHLFQDLLIGVIHVVSKVIGVTHHLEGNGRSKPVSMLRSNSVSTCNKTNTMKRQISCRNLESSTHQNEHLIQKDKLNYLAYKLDRIVSSLKTHESKEVVNKVFNIVLDLFLPDERRGEPMDSYEKARKSLSSLSNNVELTPKSIFLLNIVCEKLIRTLLEKCTNTVFLNDGPPSDGTSAEECQLFKMLQGVEDEDLGDCKGATGCEQLQGDSTSDLLENLAEMDPDVLSSDSMLTLISHSMVKSLMDKLCQNIQLPHSTPGTSKHLEGRTQERQLGFTKAKRPGFAGFGQGKGSAGHTSCDGHALTRPLNLSSMVRPKTQSPFGRKCSAGGSSASPRRRQETAIHNKLRLGSGCTSIYSATFLEEIISELFFNLSTSLCGGNESISEARLCEMNTLLVNNVVREFDRAKVAVLRSVEERLYFPPVQKALVRRVVDSVYPDVLQKYQLKVTCGVNPAHDYTSLAGQITNGILLEVLDYQLPPCFRENLSPGSPCPLEADIILRKLRGSLREFACRSRSSGGYSTRVPHSFLEDTTRRLLAQLTAPPSRASSALGRKECVSSDFSEMSNCIINKVLSAISKHKIWFTICDNPQLCAGKNTQKMVDAVYRNLTQMSDSLVAIQNGLVSRSPGMVDRIASFIIQEIIENHLQPFLCEEGLSRPTTPLDAISNMVKQVLSEVTESHRPTRPSPAGAHPGTFIGEIVAKLLAKIFSSKQNTDTELENLAQKIVSSISTQFDKATTHMLCGGREGASPSVGTDMVDELVSSIYKNVLQQHGLDPEVDTESKDGETFVENVTNLTVATISDYLLHPLFSGDLSSSRSISTAENVVSNASKPSTPSPSLSPYNTLLPYTFLEDMIRVLLSRIFSSPSDFVPSTETLKDRPRVNFNEIASNIISDIRMKISQHDIQCSEDEEEATLVYSEDDVQHLVDSVFENILQNSESQESVEQNIKGSNNVLIDRIAGFIIKHICQQHLQPFVKRKALPSPADTLPAAERRPWPPAAERRPWPSAAERRPWPPAVQCRPWTPAPKRKPWPPAAERRPWTPAAELRPWPPAVEGRPWTPAPKRKPWPPAAERRPWTPAAERRPWPSAPDRRPWTPAAERRPWPSAPERRPWTPAAERRPWTPAAERRPWPSAAERRPWHSTAERRPWPSAAERRPWPLAVERRPWPPENVYSAAFLEDVIFGVLRKIFHRVLGIVQTKPAKDSEDELLDKARKLIYLIAEELSRAQVRILEDAEEQCCLPPVESDVLQSIVDVVFSKVLQEYEMDILPDYDFLNDTKILAARVTKSILAHTFDFQIHPKLVGKLRFKSYTTLNVDVLIKKVHGYITKSRFQRQASTIYTTMLSHSHLEKVITQLVSQVGPLAASAEGRSTSKSQLSDSVLKLIHEIMSIISKHAICIVKHGGQKQSMMSEKDIQSMVDSIYAELSRSKLYQSLTKDKKGISKMPVSKIASFIIKEIFNHHLQSFLPGDKTCLPAVVDLENKQIAAGAQQGSLALVVNSAAFLEEVIAELLCKLLYAFSHNVLAAEEPDMVKGKITDIVTTLVKSIVLEFTTSEIVVSNYLDNDMCSSARYKEMVRKTANLIYEKILGEYKSLIQVYKVMQRDTTSFGRKIYHLLLEEIYDQQVQSLVSGELVSSSCASLQTDNIIRNVLNVIAKASPAAPCMTVLPRALLENIVSKLIGSIFPPAHRAREPREEGASPDDDGFLAAASKLTDDIIKEITEHEVRLTTAEENAESSQLDVIENLVDSICNNIVKKPEFQAEVKKDADKKAGSFLSKAAGFIMKEIMDHHLRPFLQGDGGSALTKPGKEKTQTSLYSATFLEDVVVDLVRKFYSLLSITEEPKENGAPETDLVGLAVKFANSLIGEFRKSEVKVLPKAEEVFAFPPVDKETVDKISNFVYDQFIGKYDSDDIQKDEEGHELIETIAGLAQKAISAFKIQPLFSGDWSSTFFSFLNPEPITQRVQHLPQKAAAPSSTGPKGNQLAFSVQSYKHTSPSGRKQVPGTSEPDRGTANRKRSLPSEEMPVRKGESPDRKVASLTRTMKCNLVSLLLGLPAGVATKKKENEKKTQVSIKSYTKDAATVTSPTTSVKSKTVASPTTSVKSKESEKSDLKGAQKNNEPEKKSKSVSTGEEKQRAEAYTQTPGAAVATEWKEKTVGPGLDQRGMGTLRKDYEPYLFPVQLNVADASTTTEGLVTPRLTFVDRKGSRPLVDINKQVADYEHVQSITENIYDNILETYFAPESEQSHTQYPPGDKVQVPQEARKDFAKSVSVRDSSLSGGKDLPAPEQEEEEYNKGAREKEKKQGGGKEKVEVKETKKEPRKPDSAQNPPKSKPGIFPAKLLEDVIIEMVNKLILGALPEARTAGRGQSASGGRHQADLHDTAMQLLDSMLKELSKAQIKVFRPERESPLAPPGSRGPSAPKGPPEQKEPRAAAAGASPPAKRAAAAGKTSQVHKVMKKFPLEVLSFLDRIPAVDKSLVNKVVHSSVCSILKEFKSPDSLRQNIKSNGGNIAKRLTSAMISEAFQHQLNLEPSDRVPAAACLPLERKDVVRKVQKAVRTASKECQTSSPYTILLPHEFLHNVISALLHKIFSIAPKTTADAAPEGGGLSELDFLQVKLLGTVMAEISKDEDMTIRYVESLHPNDEEVTQLVALSIYENLRSQFGSQETIRKCVASGCRILSESIVELVLREVSGNQLQSYFSGELTPCQCAEVDSIIDNILKDVLCSTDTPRPPPTPAHRLHYNVMEEIAVQFLCKLLSVFPKVDKKRNKSLETEMQNIMSKILTSLQEFISKSKIKLIPPAKELPTVPLADNETIEKVVNSVYSRVLKHSGSHTSIFKDLMGKSNVLSDIIGFLMVKEISNSKFQPQGEEEVSSSELVLEAVKIMEKVVKIVDEFKPQDKSSSKKGSTLDVTCLEEALALFLAKLVKLPSATSKDAKNLSKPELNKIASQLTKSVTAEISKSNISLVAADSEGQVLHPKSVEMISQVIDSIYSNVLIQSGSYKDLYYDIRGTNRVFPKKVADLIIHSVTEVSLGTDPDRSQNPNADPFGDLDVNRIVQKAQEHASNMSPDSKNESPEQISSGEDTPIKIVPHIGNKPLKIDPAILSEHLAVISVKTLPLEKLQVECLRNTGHSIADVRRASIQGKCYSAADTANGEKMKKERRTSLTRSGHLDVKPLEPVGRNSFQNIRKPDISKVELLKDVQGKQDLLVRLVVHDIEAKSEKYLGEEAATNDSEFVLKEDIREEKGEQLFDDKAMGADTESPEPTWKPSGGPKGRAIELDRSTNSTIIAVTESCWGTEPQGEKEEPEPGEPIHHLVHRIMSTSSYNQEDLGLPASETKASAPDTPDNTPGTPANSPSTPAKAPEGAPRPSASKQGSGMLARVTSALSKVFSRSGSSSSASKAAAPAQR